MELIERKESKYWMDSYERSKDLRKIERVLCSLLKYTLFPLGLV